MTQNKMLVFFTVGLLVFLFFPQGIKAEPYKQTPGEDQMSQFENSGLNVGIKLFGGLGQPVGQNDVDKHLNGWNQLLDDVANTFGYNVNGKILPLEYGPIFGGELIFGVNPRVSIGLGAGYFLFSKQGTKTLNAGGELVNIDMKPTISAVPLTLSLYYGLPLGNFLKVVAGVGAGYYLGQYKSSNFQGFVDEEITLLFESKKNTIGAHGSLNLEFNIGRAMALVFGISGRYAVLKDLIGTEILKYVNPSYTESETYPDLTLWYLEEEFDGRYYASLVPSGLKPEESYYRNVRKAEISLSSMALQIGILIRLSQLFK